MSDWIKNNAFFLRASVFVVFAAWIGAPACSYIFKDMPNVFVKQGGWDGCLKSLDRESLEKFKADINEMKRQAELKGTAYGAKSWLNDFARMHELATEYGIPHSALTGSVFQQHLGILDRYIENRAVFGPHEVPESEDECDEARARLAIARGEPIPQEKTGAELWAEIWPNLPKAGWFLLKLYLQIMLFCLFWFPLRLVQRGSWDWINNTTLRDELLLAPGRFVRAVIFWPAWFNVYGKFTDPAKALRYARLKVEYLRQKSGLEQLTPQEEQHLHEQAEKPLEEFARAIAALKGQRALVKRSLAAAMLWFLLGFFLAPFASPRSKVFQTAGFCSSSVFAFIIDKVVEKATENLKPSPRSPPMLELDVICEWLELPENRGQAIYVPAREFCWMPDKIVFAIDHVPRRLNIFQKLKEQMGAC